MSQLFALLDSYGIRFGLVLTTVLIILGGYIIVFAVNRILLRWLTGIEMRLRLPYETVLLVSRVLTGVLWLFIGLVVLSTWGVGVTGMWAFIVSAATAIGVGFLATWTMVSNVTANLFLAFWHPFRLGQDLELLPEGMKGRVVERNMMFTVLREKESVLYVPNNLFFQKVYRVNQADDQYLFEFLERSTRSDRVREPAPVTEKAG